MQRRHLTLITALGGMGLVARPGLTVPRSEADALRAANLAFTAALSARDLARLEALWAHDETVMALHPQDRARVTGWDAVRRSWQEIFAHYTEMAVSMPEPRIHLMGDAALVAGMAHFRGFRAGGRAAFSAMVTDGYEKREGRWLLVQHHATMMQG